jgi:hypothetical protein
MHHLLYHAMFMFIRWSCLCSTTEYVPIISFLTFVDMLLYKMYALYALYVIVQTIVTACFSTRNGRNRNGFQYHDVIFHSNQITLRKNTHTHIYIYNCLCSTCSTHKQHAAYTELTQSLQTL